MLVFAVSNLMSIQTIRNFFLPVDAMGACHRSSEFFCSDGNTLQVPLAFALLRSAPLKIVMLGASSALAILANDLLLRSSLPFAIHDVAIAFAFPFAFFTLVIPSSYVMYKLRSFSFFPQ